jgi:hypothetical protein
MLLLTEGFETSSLLVISAVIVGAIRMTSYYREDISKEISKFFPLALLGIAMTKPGFFILKEFLKTFLKYQILQMKLHIIFFL